MDFIPKKSMKRIWIFNFPPTQTVCDIQCVEKRFKQNSPYLDIILSYELPTGSSGTDFSLTDTVSIRSVENFRLYLCSAELKMNFVYV